MPEWGCIACHSASVLHSASSAHSKAIAASSCGAQEAAQTRLVIVSPPHLPAASLTLLSMPLLSVTSAPTALNIAELRPEFLTQPNNKIETSNLAFSSQVVTARRAPWRYATRPGA